MTMNQSWPMTVACVFLLVFLATDQVQAKDSFTTISSSMLSIDKCIPHAYGNFNADKYMDIFCVSNSGQRVEIWLATDKEPVFNNYKNLDLNDTKVVNLIPGDFNGDSVIDLLVIHKKGSNKYFEIRLYIGQKSSIHENDISEGHSISYSYKLMDEPLAVDLNGDGIMDLFGQDENGDRKYFYFDQNGMITAKPQLLVTPTRSLLTGYSNSVSDMDNDYSPDLLITSKGDNNEPFFEIWTKMQAEYEQNTTYNVPDGLSVYGQSIFADFDSDGHFEHLLPACLDSQCLNSTLFIYKNKKWSKLAVDFAEFSFARTNTDVKNLNTPITVKFGDYNLDGYVDLLVVMTSSIDKKTVALLLHNVPCVTTDQCTSFSRTFKIDLNANQLQTANNVVLASFFDLFDDVRNDESVHFEWNLGDSLLNLVVLKKKGTLDVIILVKSVGSDVDPSNPFEIVSFKNEMHDDVFFLKVMVMPGRCGVSVACPFGSLPYGMNYATPFAKIQLQSFEYKTMTLYASQLSQSSHLALQLPFTIFGLGSTANFVDSLIVGIDVEENGQSIRMHKEWTSIIPNSQLVISANPRDNTYFWKMQLFMTRSKNIIITGISLASTMVCLTFGIILLQYREKKIDEKERKLESQRFHFDGL